MILATPGPTPVPEDIRFAMSEKTIHHRTKEFEAIFAEARALLFKLFDMPEVLMLASTGSGAMEAAVTNLCNQKALVVNAGKFGERFGKICQAFGKELTELTYEWNTPADVNEIIDALKNDPTIDAIFVEICESAGGLRHPVEQIAKAAKAINPNIAIITDGITAVGVEPIDTTHIDAIVAGSQKAFMLPPGLSMIGLSQLALERIKQNDAGFYFNLNHEIKNQQKNTTAWTAATTLIIGLKAVLEQMFDMGLETLYKKTKARSLATNQACEALGLTIYPKTPAPSMTTVWLEGRAETMRKILKEKHRINVAGGQEHLKGNIFRINQMGFIEEYESAWIVNAIELALCEMDDRTFTGIGNKTFIDTYYQELKS